MEHQVKGTELFIFLLYLNKFYPVSISTVHVNIHTYVPVDENRDEFKGSFELGKEKQKLEYSRRASMKKSKHFAFLSTAPHILRPASGMFSTAPRKITTNVALKSAS